MDHSELSIEERRNRDERLEIMAYNNERVYLDGLEQLYQRHLMAAQDRQAYGHLLRDDRTKTGTVSRFAVHQTYVCKDNVIPLISTKKVMVKSMMAELLWFLEGSTNTYRLNELGSKIWDEWRPEIKEEDLQRLLTIAHEDHNRETTNLLLSEDIIRFASVKDRENVIPDDWEMFSMTRSSAGADEYRHPDYNAIVVKRLLEKGFVTIEDLGRVGGLGFGTYSKNWMSWDDYVHGDISLTADADLAQKGYKQLVWNEDSTFGAVLHRSINQIENLIQGLIDNPFGRRHVVWAWNPGKVDQTELPPCHMGFVCHVEPMADGNMQLNMHMTQRSQDVFLGAPFNIASYGALLQLLATLTGYKAGTLSILAVDQHLYLNHIEQAREQLIRAPIETNRPQLVWDVEPGSGLYGFRAMMERVKKDNAHPYAITGYEHHGRIAAPVAVRAEDRFGA